MVVLLYLIVRPVYVRFFSSGRPSGTPVCEDNNHDDARRPHL